KAAEIGFVEFLVWRELPEQGAEAGAKLCYAAAEESPDGVGSLRKDGTVGGVLDGLEREHKTIRRLARPFAVSRRRLRAVEGAVNLDRGQAFARVGELFRVRQSLWIERAPPGREGPAADADADLSGLHRHDNDMNAP